MGNNQIIPVKNKFSLIKQNKLYKLLLKLEEEDYDSEIIAEHIENIIIMENINQKNKYGETLLLWVIGNFSGVFLFKLVNLLLQYGADPNLVGNLNLSRDFYNNPEHLNYVVRGKMYTHPSIYYRNITPLFAMTRHIGSYANYQTIESLFRYGAVVDFKFNIYISFHRFHNKYDLDILKLLVNNDLDIISLLTCYLNNNRQSIYNTPIMLMNYSCMKNCSNKLKIDILKFMIDSGNDLSFTTFNGLDFWSTFKPEDYHVKYEIIKYLESKKINNSLFIAKDCLICYESNKQLCLTNCNHAVCCIDCFSKLRNYTCPYCKQNLNINHYQLINFISD